MCPSPWRNDHRSVDQSWGTGARCTSGGQIILINVPEYLVKVTKFSTSVRQAVEYSKIIYDMFVRRELIKISEETIDSAKLNDLDTSGQTIIENSERQLFDLAEKGSFNSSLIKFDDAMKQTIEMASAAYKNEEGIVGVPTGLRD